jgi:hypothetical protein
MDYSRVVGILQGRGDLGDIVQDSGQGETRSPRMKPAQRAAGGVGHHQKG